MYIISLLFQFDEIGMYEIDEVFTDHKELREAYNNLVDKWFKRICPDLIPDSSLSNYHLILRRINEMNNKDDKKRIFKISIEEIK
jgi:hypothetical protein